MEDLKPYEVMILVKHLKCLRCTHTWIQKGKALPGVCPACRSPYWDRPRKVKPVIT